MKDFMHNNSKNVSYLKFHHLCMAVFFVTAVFINSPASAKKRLSNSLEKNIRILNNKNKGRSVREQALILISKSKGNRAINALTDALIENEYWAIRRTAAMQLVKYTDSRVLDSLIAALSSDPNIFVRSEAAKTLGQLKNERSLKALIEALESDPNVFVRSESARALGESGNIKAVDPLKKGLNDDGMVTSIIDGQEMQVMEVRNAARKALKNIAKIYPMAIAEEDLEDPFQNRSDRIEKQSDEVEEVNKYQIISAAKVAVEPVSVKGLAVLQPVTIEDIKEDNAIVQAKEQILDQLTLNTTEELEKNNKKILKPWALQLAVYGSKRKAEKKVKKIQSYGYNAYIVEKERSNGGIWYRLRLGFYFTKEEAGEYAKDIHEKFGFADVWVVKPSQREVIEKMAD